MLKGLTLISLILLSLITTLPLSVSKIDAQVINLSESINVFHIYNETVFNLNITYSNNTDILNLSNSMNYINNYTIIIFNINQTERTLRWYFSQYNPLNNFDFFIDRGFVIRFKSSSLQSLNLRDLEMKLDLLYRTKFFLYKKDSNEAIFISGGNYNSYINSTLKLISYNFGGLYNIIKNNTPNAIIYTYTNSGVRNFQAFFFSPYTVSSDVYSSNIFKIDYSRYLGNLTRSSHSSVSQIHFYLFGLIPINSTLNITWSTGYDKNWVAESTYNLTNFNKIGNVIIRVSKLDPFIIVYQRLDPAITNSSAKLIVSVMNIGTLNVPEVTVKLNIPDWLKANNQTLIFKNVSSVMQQKYVNVTVNGNLNPGVYEINAPTCYYTYNSTSIATIGNTVQFGYKAGKLPSLSFYLRPSVTEWPDLFTGLADFNVFIINTGNYNASDVEIDMDYYKAIVGDLGAGKNITYPISIQPSLINQVPQGASVFNSVLVKYYNGTQSYVVKIPSPSIATIGSSFTFINYMSAKAEVYNQVINQTSMYFRWIGSTLGSARSATVTIYMNNITSQGLLYAGHDSFNNYGSTLQATFSNARGYQTYIALNLNLTRRDAFVIPAFVTISPFSKSILIDPIVFINALVITKSTNSSIIKINSPVEINLVAKNYGSAPLYNVSLKDILATGWNVISGVTEGYKDVLLPNESLSINYVAVPKTPQTSNIGTSNVTFKLFGLNITSALTSFQLKISVSVSFNVYKWNKATLSSGSVVIYDLNNNLVAQLPINNGKVDWEGYIGVFSVVVKYQNVDVFTEKLNITSQTRSVNLTVNVFDIEVNVYDAFGFKVSNAEVQLIGNFNEIAQAGSFYSLSNVPQGVYILSVKIGDYLYKIPINIDNSTSTVIDIHLPVLVLGNFTLNISYLIGVLLILFIALFIILYFRKEKFSS